MNRGGSEEGGVEKVDGDGLSALKISYGHGMDDDDDLDYLDDIELPPGFESDEEEEEERKPRQTITRDTNTVSEVQSKVDKEKDKQAALMRKVRKSQGETKEKRVGERKGEDNNNNDPNLYDKTCSRSIT